MAPATPHGPRRPSGLLRRPDGVVPHLGGAALPGDWGGAPRPPERPHRHRYVFDRDELPGHDPLRPSRDRLSAPLLAMGADLVGVVHQLRVQQQPRSIAHHRRLDPLPPLLVVGAGGGRGDPPGGLHHDHLLARDLRPGLHPLPRQPTTPARRPSPVTGQRSTDRGGVRGAGGGLPRGDRPTPRAGTARRLGAAFAHPSAGGAAGHHRRPRLDRGRGGALCLAAAGDRPVVLERARRLSPGPGRGLDQQRARGTGGLRNHGPRPRPGGAEAGPPRCTAGVPHDLLPPAPGNCRAAFGGT